MKSAQALDVQTEVNGDVPHAAVGIAVAKIRSLLRYAPEPVLFARVTLSIAADPAVERPAVAGANLDLNGRLISAHAAAAEMRDAIDRMTDRLRARLERTARNWPAARGHRPAPGQWRHASAPAQHTPYFPRPVEERSIISRASYAQARQTVDEAAADMDLLGYDFHLFTERATGQDSVIYRGADGYCLAQARPRAGGGPGPVHLPVTVSDQPPPRLGPAAAAARLEALGVAFLFFVNTEDGHGSVIYHRYDGHYGLISPSGRR